MSSKKVTGFKLMLKTSVVSGMTLVSRVLGLVRDIVFARYFGASLVMDAFLVANRIPNMLRRFFAEGAFSQGFVPVMARYREKHSHEDAREFVDAIAGTFGVILFLVTLAGVVAAPLLVAVVAPGFIGEDGRFDLATLMLRFTFPYLFFVSLTAFAGGILNTYGRFAVPAFTPVILNIVLIAGAIWLSPLLEEPGMALAYAVFVAGVFQLLFQVPFLMRIRALPRPKWAIHHEGVRRAGRLMLPAIFGSSVAQLNVLVGGIIASMLGVGKISLLYYSDRLMEFPLGLFGIALATVTLPYMSRQ
jgi:putative peptidoglycan lipid II flippase